MIRRWPRRWAQSERASCVARTPTRAWVRALPMACTRLRTRRAGSWRSPTCRGSIRRPSRASSRRLPTERASRRRFMAASAGIPSDSGSRSTKRWPPSRATKARKHWSPRIATASCASTSTIPGFCATWIRRKIFEPDVIPAKAGIQSRSLENHWVHALASRRASALRLPHVALPADDPVFLFLHSPPVAELRLLERARDEESLRFLAAVALEESELRRGLDALGDHPQAQRMRQGDDRLRDRLVVAVLLEAVDESLIDFHRLNRQPGEIGQARIAGSEVVDGDRHAALLQLHQRGDGLFRMRDDDAFGDLEIEIMGGQGARRERFVDDAEPAVVLQLLYRQVDRQL